MEVTEYVYNRPAITIAAMGAVTVRALKTLPRGLRTGGDRRGGGAAMLAACVRSREDLLRSDRGAQVACGKMFMARETVVAEIACSEE